MEYLKITLQFYVHNSKITWNTYTIRGLFTTLLNNASGFL